MAVLIRAFVAGESNLRLKLGDFGTFVIFAAVYAAGTLGLPTFSFLAYQVKVGEMASAFVAIFGMPAILGLTLGQFIANLGIQASPITMLSPIFSFLGLLGIYYLRRRSILAGTLTYVAITGVWLSVMLPIAKPGLTNGLAMESAFANQLISVMVGYCMCILAARTMIPPNKAQQAIHPDPPASETDTSSTQTAS